MTLTLRKPTYPALERAADRWYMQAPVARHERMMRAVRQLGGGNSVAQLRAEQAQARAEIHAAVDGRDWRKWRQANCTRCKGMGEIPCIDLDGGYDGTEPCPRCRYENTRPRLIWPNEPAF